MKWLMSVDPGLSTGIALFRARGDYNWTLNKTWLVGGGGGSRAWKTRAFATVKQVAAIIETQTAQRYLSSLVIEMPCAYSTEKGTAAVNSDALVKLAFVCGGIACYAHCIDFRVTTITPHEWKGQLSKAQVRERVKRLIPRDKWPVKQTSDEWDAIGIGLHHLGLFQ